MLEVMQDSDIVKVCTGIVMTREVVTGTLTEVVTSKVEVLVDVEVTKGESVSGLYFCGRGKGEVTNRSLSVRLVLGLRL